MLLGRQEEAVSMQQRLAALNDDSLFIRYLRYHLDGLLALLGGREAEAAAALDKAVSLEVQLPMARVAGSARLLQARLLLGQGQYNAAFAAASPVLTEWNNNATLGFALLADRKLYLCLDWLPGEII